MKTTAVNYFAAPGKDSPGTCVRLAVARELATIYTDVLREPMPIELQTLLEILEARRRSRPEEQGLEHPSSG
jgi:hypothetical protein